MTDERLKLAATDGDVVSLTFVGGTAIRLHGLWLRDLCRCAECRIAGSGRRLAEAFSVPLDTTLDSVEVDADDSALIVHWSDGRRGEFSSRWLHRQQVDAPGPVERTNDPTRWRADDLLALPEITFDEIRSGDVGALRWLAMIEDVGFAVVSGVPTTRTVLTELTSLIGPIRASNYGVDWDIEASVEPANPVYSASALSPHTDLPYRALPPGLQLLLCDVAEAPGGASTLVDGYRIAADIEAERPDDWAVLTTVEVPFIYLDETYDLRHAAPVVEVLADGSYGIIRHAPGIMGPLPRPVSRFTELYGALHRFTAMTNDPAYQVAVRLEPGQLLSFDNHRLLHGRTDFDLGAGGRRHLYGSYADLDDLRSALRMLRRRTAAASSPT